MKRFIPYFLLLILPVILWPFEKPLFSIHEKVLYKSACDTPFTYAIGTVDPRFKLPETDFLQITQQAATIWNNTSGKKIISYDPKASFTVNLVFDERQLLNNQINELETDLNSEKSSLTSEVSEYERLSSAFKDRLNAFNSQVTYWNSQGGAPREEYEKLTKEQEELKTQADRLNELARKLNRSTDSYNVNVGKLNNTINTFKKELERKPEEGVYNPQEQRIDIYFNINRKELLHTLLHEFGHALTLDHTENEDSLMFPFTTAVIVPSEEDIATITKHCEKQHIITFTVNNVTYLLQTLITQYKKP